MKLFTSIPSALLAAALTVWSVSASVQDRVQKFHHKRAEQLEKSADFVKRTSGSLQTRATPSYLNNKTQPFAVDGSSLLNVTFDVGESYAGLLPVDDTGKELFFWFFPSSNVNASDEITIWLNGGPGCSSLDGFFKENGPVVWQSGQYLPVKNQYSWTNLTNMVWIDQPVGTGYSQGKPNATSEADVAAQFLPFWKSFMDTFDLQGRKVYVTGESYAGQYVPYIADAMISKNDTQYYNANGILIYDPSIGEDLVTEQIPTLAFVERNHNVMPFNDTFMAELRNISATCGYDAVMEAGLTFPPAGPIALPDENTLPQSCDIFDAAFDAIFLLNPCFNIYLVNQGCPLLWDVLGFPYSDFYFPPGYTNPYFNHSEVKTSLHIPQNTSWEICSSDPVFVLPNGRRSPDRSAPSGSNGGPIKRIAEKTNNVIVGHGLLDMVLISNGSLITLNNLTWNGQQGFSTPPTTEFYVPYHETGAQESWAGAGIFGHFVTERGLTFVEIDQSGHMVPEYTPSAGYRHLEFLLGRIKGLDDRSPFTTQPEVVQPAASASGSSPSSTAVPVDKFNFGSRPNFGAPHGRYYKPGPAKDNVVRRGASY